MTAAVQRAGPFKCDAIHAMGTGVSNFQINTETALNLISKPTK